MKHRLMIPVLLGVSLQAAAQPAPYEHRYYDQGYQVFVETGDLERARQVVDNALYWRPDDPLWIERRARVAGWQGDLEASLAAWLRLAEQHGSEEGWRQILELAPLTFDDALALRAHRRLLAAHPTDPALIERVASEYERVGQAREGLAFLDRWSRRYPSRALFRALQRLAENTGQDSRAAGYYRAYMDRYGPEPEMAGRAAELTWLQGERLAAYRRLREDAGALGYQERLVRRQAVMATELGDWPAALDAYQRLAEAGDARPGDDFRYLALARYQAPDRVADIYDRLWRATGDPRLAIGRLAALRENGDRAALRRFFDGLGPDQRRTLEQLPAYLRARADYRLREGDPDGARRALRQALALADDTENRLAWLWLMIALNDDTELAASLARWEPVSRADPRYREVFAAANLALDRPEAALPYQRALLRAAPDDWRRRWILAQTLLAAGLEDRAWPILHRLWRDPPPTAVAAEDRGAYQEMRSALATRFESGDRQLRFQQRAWAATERADRADRAEWLAQWALAIDAPELARAWYRRQQAWRPGGLPPGSALALATLDSDYDQLRALRADRAGALTAGERLEVDNTLGRQRWAAAQLAEQQRWAPALADAHPQQETLLLPASRRVTLAGEQRRLGALELDQADLGQTLPMGDRWHWQWGLMERRFRSRDRARLRVDETSRRGTVALARDGNGLDARLQVGYADRFDRQDPEASLALAGDPGARWGWRLTYEWQAPADETSELLLAGTRSGAGLELDWQPASHWQNGLSLARRTYQDLDQRDLGEGWRVDAQSTWRPWRSRWSPGLRVRHTRAGYSGQRPLRLDADLFQPQAADALALPLDYHETEVALLLGQPDLHPRPHRLQAWSEIGLTDNSRFGTGFSGRVGVEGPLLGRDGWRLYGERALNVGGADEDGYRIGLEYEFYY